MIKRVTDTAGFIIKAKEKHGIKYDYSQVIYKKSDSKIQILCPEHGIFEQIPNSHLSGKGCTKCGLEKLSVENSLNFDEFINKAKKIHENKYDYSQASFQGSKVKIKIACQKHGIFEQVAGDHLSGHGCPKCARELETYNQMTTETFIEKARKVHGAKYDYSLVEYKKSRFKVKIICPKHGVFEQIPNNHLRGMECIKCGLIKVQEFAESRKLSTQEFIDKAVQVHGNRFDYSKTEYSSCSTEVKIVCPKHGEFSQIPSVHLAGKGCRECSDEKHRSNQQEFLDKVRKVHGDRYDYSLVDYVTTREKVKIKCPKHGIFEQTPANHLKGQGCPVCLESQGEREIALFLSSHQIEFEREKDFKNCRNIKPLFFDFYIPKLNTCIEYDGIQHFSPIDYFGGIPIFKQTQKSDALKNSYCNNNGIKLIRIPYTKQDPALVLEKELGLYPG
jgi:very-short-patch-repair endonuclease